MPKKTKIEKSAPEENVNLPVRTSPVAKPARARKKPAAKKAATPRKPKTPAAPAAAPEPSDEEIRLRAYFIAERRHRFDLSGDADSDWLEAKRQLLSETRPH